MRLKLGSHHPIFLRRPIQSHCPTPTIGDVNRLTFLDLVKNCQMPNFRWRRQYNIGSSQGHTAWPHWPRDSASWRPVLVVVESPPPQKKKLATPPKILGLSSFYADNDLQQSAPPPNVPISPQKTKTSRKPWQKTLDDGRIVGKNLAVWPLLKGLCPLSWFVRCQSFLMCVVGQSQPSVRREGTNRVRWPVSKKPCPLSQSFLRMSVSRLT